MSNKTFPAVGQRAVVIAPPDQHCDHPILFGIGTITAVSDRVTVRFDAGSGGVFFRSNIRPEPSTWHEVAEHLRYLGWTTQVVHCGDLPPWEWRSPNGISGLDYRSHHHDEVPEAVMQHAYRSGEIAFTYLGPKP